MNAFMLAVFVSLFCWSAFAKRDANSRFKLCCSRQTTADVLCKKRFCDFNSLRQDNVLLFLNLCSSKGDSVKLMWQCATSKTDHTSCCKKRNVPKECLKYCDYSRAPPPADYLNHLICLNSFDKVKECFRTHLEHNPNIYGDF